MLEYGWGNPSSIILPGEENAHESEPSSRSVVFNPYSDTANFANHFAATPHHLAFHSPQAHYTTSYNYDSRAYSYSASASSYPPSASTLNLGPAAPTGFVVLPKSEQVVGGLEYGTDFNSRIGLNLGGRTYFASSEDDFVNRLYRRPRILEPGSLNSPRCQVEGCQADLTHAKHYHRRHKVCEFHSKAASVIVAGLTQRFCQQCSRFHLLSEFDNGKRSCRKRLADHNRRRRKSQQTTTFKSHLTSSSENLARSTPHSSSLRVDISPPRISVHTAASTTASSVLYSNG